MGVQTWTVRFVTRGRSAARAEVVGGGGQAGGGGGGRRRRGIQRTLDDPHVSPMKPTTLDSIGSDSSLLSETTHVSP